MATLQLAKDESLIDDILGDGPADEPTPAEVAAEEAELDRSLNEGTAEDPRVNEHGVFIDYETVEIPIKKKHCCTASIKIIERLPGYWLAAVDVGYSKGDLGGIGEPLSNSTASWATRGEALLRACDRIFVKLRGDVETPDLTDADYRRANGAAEDVQKFREKLAKHYPQDADGIAIGNLKAIGDINIVDEAGKVLLTGSDTEPQAAEPTDAAIDAAINDVPEPPLFTAEQYKQARLAAERRAAANEPYLESVEAKRLAEIKAKRQEVREAEIQHELDKSRAKASKEYWERKVGELTDLIDQDLETYPLWEGQAAAKPETIQPASETANAGSKTAVVIDGDKDGWRIMCPHCNADQPAAMVCVNCGGQMKDYEDHVKPAASTTPAREPAYEWESANVDELLEFGLTKKMVEKLVEAGCDTLGKVEELRAGAGLASLHRVGPVAVTKYEDAILAWLSQHRDKLTLEHASAMAADKAASEPVKAQEGTISGGGEGEGQADEPDRTSPPLPPPGATSTTTPAGIAATDPDALAAQQIEQRADEIGMAFNDRNNSEILLATNHEAAWEAGRAAYDSGLAIFDCPYVPGEEQDDWLRGWLKLGSLSIPAASGDAADSEPTDDAVSEPAESESATN